MFIFGSPADMIWFLERWISNEYFRFIIYSRIYDMRMARRSWDNFLVWLSRVLICDGFVEKFNSCQDMLDSEFLLDLLNQLGCSLISFAMGLAVDENIAIMIKFFIFPEISGERELWWKQADKLRTVKIDSAV